MGTDNNIRELEVTRTRKNKKVSLNISREKFFEELIKIDPILRKPTVKSASGETYNIVEFDGVEVGESFFDEINDLSPKSLKL